MQLDIEISKECESALRQEWGDLSQAAKEALAIESYRTGKISAGFLAEMLGMGVLEARDWLAKRGIPVQCTPDDLAADTKDLSELFPIVGR